MNNLISYLNFYKIHFVDQFILYFVINDTIVITVLICLFLIDILEITYFIMNETFYCFFYIYDSVFGIY